jgi:hypothetical protein
MDKVKEKRVCCVEGCDTPNTNVSRYKSGDGKLYCRKHYLQIKRHGEIISATLLRNPNEEVCVVEGCNGKPHAKGHCDKHYRSVCNYGGNKCSVVGCTDFAVGNGYCSKHYSQIERYGVIRERTKYTPNEIILHDVYAEIVLYNNLKDNIEIARTSISIEHVSKCETKKWRLNKKGYVISGSDNEMVFLHDYIMECPKDLTVDHIDKNPLNNLNENLRICTHQQNCFNRGRKNNKSGVIGVCWCKERNKWIASIKIDYKQISLGRSDNFEEAVKVRLKAEQKYFGEFAPQKHLFEQYGIENLEVI